MILNKKGRTELKKSVAGRQLKAIFNKPKHLRTEPEQWWLYGRGHAVKYLDHYIGEVEWEQLTPEARAKENARQAECDRIFGMTSDELVHEYPEAFKDWQNDVDKEAWHDRCGMPEFGPVFGKTNPPRLARSPNAIRRRP